MKGKRHTYQHITRHFSFSGKRKKNMAPLILKKKILIIKMWSTQQYSFKNNGLRVHFKPFHCLQLNSTNVQNKDLKGTEVKNCQPKICLIDYFFIVSVPIWFPSFSNIMMMSSSRLKIGLDIKWSFLNVDWGFDCGYIRSWDLIVVNSKKTFDLILPLKVTFTLYSQHCIPRRKGM